MIKKKGCIADTLTLNTQVLHTFVEYKNGMYNKY